MKKSLSKKETMFCYHFVETGNIIEAFSMSGMKNSPESLPRLMSDQMIRNQILQNYEYKKLNLGIRAEVGYERLAFGDISDSIKLKFIKNFDDFQIEKMDLFNISEIKRLKDGTMEIKFFDRMKALEKLQKIESEQSDNDFIPFYSALENSVKNASPPDNNET